MKKTAMCKKLFLPAVLPAACCWHTRGFLTDSATPAATSGKECHEEIVGTFGSNIHSKAAYYGAKNAGCE
jgi:hypothetical protein